MSSRQTSNRVTSKTSRKAGATGQLTLEVGSNPAKVSRDPVGAKTTRKGDGGVSEPRRLSKDGLWESTRPRIAKEPSESQYVQMAGAMANAIERLRTEHEVARCWAAANLGWIDPLRSPAVLKAMMDAVNILRVGLKARSAKR